VGDCWIENFDTAKHKADYISAGDTPAFKKAEKELYIYLKSNLK
jgi:hypothetical protein